MADPPHLALAVFKSPTRYLVVFASVDISFIQIVQAWAVLCEISYCDCVCDYYRLILISLSELDKASLIKANKLY